MTRILAAYLLRILLVLAFLWAVASLCACGAPPVKPSAPPTKCQQLPTVTLQAGYTHFAGEWTWLADEAGVFTWEPPIEVFEVNYLGSGEDGEL